MDPLFAPELENFFPNGATVDLRNGYRQHATGVGPGIVGSLHEYVQEDGDRFLLGFETGNAWNATSAGAATDITGAATLIGNGSNLYTVNFRNLIFIKENEGTPVYTWNGTGNLAAAGFTGPSGADSALARMTTYKNRIYFAGLTTASVWYGGLDAVTGALTEFPCLSLFRLGGYIAFVGSTSLSGFSVEEVFVIISNQGEILLYQGDYPGASNWGIVGRYYIPAPAGLQAYFYWGQDILVITKQGLVALSDAIATGSKREFQFFSDNIAPTFKTLVQAALDIGSSVSHYINGVVYPGGPYLVVNIPTSTAVSVQLVMNLITKAWCKFTGQNAFRWALFNQDLYYAGNAGKIFKADNGYFDENPTSPGVAQARTIKLRHSYNNFGTPEIQKQFTQAIPRMFQSEGFALTMDVDVDFADTAATQVVTPDTSDTSYKLYQPNVGLNGIGNAGSIRIDGTVTTKRMSLQATQVFWNEGDI